VSSHQLGKGCCQDAGRDGACSLVLAVEEMEAGTGVKRKQDGSGFQLAKMGGEQSDLTQLG
jgi:hypothetical protein